VLDDGANHSPRLDQEAIDSCALLHLGTALHSAIDKDLIENNASRHDRVGSRWTGRSLDADVFDPCPMPEDAPCV